MKIKLKQYNKALFLLTLVVSIFLLTKVSFAATGTIDPFNASSVLLQDTSNINWDTTGGDPVIVSDTSLIGDIYGATVGWITLDPAFGGVVNSCTGDLSGYAFGSTSGWVNFGPFLNSPTQSVTIDTTTGEFDGYAWSQNFGWIEFDCSVPGRCVTTTWNGCTTPSGGGGGGDPDPMCDDGDDNDGDGLVDYPDDPGCVDENDDTETNIIEEPTLYACNDGLDNDGDGYTDFLSDPGCAGPYDSNEYDYVPDVPIDEEEDCAETGTCGGDDDDICIGEDCNEDGGGDDEDNDPTGPVPPTNDDVDEPNGDFGDGEIASFVEGHKDESMYAGLISGIIASIIPLFFSLSRLVGSLGSMSSLFTTFFGYRSKKKPWGTVYDSVTKQPLDPAYVVLYDSNMSLIGESITDMDGRYGFLVNPGAYTLVANKTHYLFPSKKLEGKSKDELYTDLYFGDVFNISDRNDIVNKNIPLDPLEFDWNEFEKRKHHMNDFYKKSDVVLSKVLNFIFFVGLVWAITVFFLNPNLLINQIAIGLYALVLVLKATVFRWRAFGMVFEKSDKSILSFAIIRVVTQAGNEIAHRVTDEWGRYYLLVKKGVYNVSVEKKMSDGTYLKVHEEVVKAKHGIINKTFKI